MSDLSRAITLMISGMLAFSIGDLFLKLSTQSLPVGQVMIVLGVGTGCIFAVMLRRQNRRILSPDARHPIVIMRCVGEAVGAIGMFVALTYMPLSTVAALAQALPLLLTLMAALFLGERLRIRRMIAICIGFIGVLIIIRPGLEGFSHFSWFAIIGMVGMAVRDLGSRMAPPQLHTLSMSFYASVAMALTGVGMLLISGGANIPDQHTLFYLLAMVGAAAMGILCVTNAMRAGDVAVTSLFRYTRLIFASLAGILVLQESLDGPTILGSIFIVGAGLYSWLRERRLSRTQP